ncbi:MAG: YfcC family protein [Oscillospiraceae bacterium]|nr:YfcC family protein [Oscillospiraceae bacterium]
MAEEKKNEGLQINKKTIVGITAILLAVWVFAGILTQVVPCGEYTTIYDMVSGKEEITTDSVYVPIRDFRLPLWKIVAAPVMVFVEHDTRGTGMTGILIVVFIVLMGGTFLLLERAGVLNYIVAAAIKRFSRRKYLLMAVLVFFFMALASTAGIFEESVTLVPITVAVALALGWDSLVGLSMSLVAVAFGFTAATFNPFNVMTVQKLAGDVEIFSGLWLRLIVFALVYAVLLAFLMTYAKKIERDPKKSLVYESDAALREKYASADPEAVLADKATGRGARAFGVCLVGAFVCIILDFILGMEGTLSMGGLALCFLTGGLLAGKLSGMKGKELLSGFLTGIRTIAPALPLIFMVISVAYILNTGKIMHTILYCVYGALSQTGGYGAILIIFLFIALLEIFIGSGTAKAFLVMPLVIPLAHLMGISSNTVALTFAMADGFTNLLYPTSGIMIIAIGLIGVSYGKWLRFTWKLFAMEAVVAVAVMLFAVWVGYA